MLKMSLWIVILFIQIYQFNIHDTWYEQEKISKNTIYLSSLAMSLSLFSLLVLTNVYATHISEPILILDKYSKYNMNETISVSGWVKYNDKPASNVLVLLKI